MLKLLVTGTIMGLIDAIWLSVIAKRFYYSQLGSLLLEKPNMVAAVLFYIIYVIGIVIFALNPALSQKSWQSAAGLGSLFGFVAYATYDLTNLATIKGFNTTVVVVDMIWGTVLTATVATLAYLIIQRWSISQPLV
ncbi:DUF2177 family protein [bacterium]|nr:MAG: DUF2177 family protein [bacterium]